MVTKAGEGINRKEASRLSWQRRWVETKEQGQRIRKYVTCAAVNHLTALVPALTQVSFEGSAVTHPKLRLSC